MRRKGGINGVRTLNLHGNNMNVPYGDTGGALWIGTIVLALLAAHWVFAGAGITEEQSGVRACLVFPFSTIAGRVSNSSIIPPALLFIQFPIYGLLLYLAFSRGWTWKAYVCVATVHGAAALISLALSKPL